MSKWKPGDPLTPAMVEKGKKTRADKKAEASIVDVRSALQRFIAMDTEELHSRVETRVFEYIARSLINVACVEGKDQLRAIQEIMDRIYGKNKPTPEVPREIGRRAIMRQTLDEAGTRSTEAWLRKRGLDEEADKVAGLWHEQEASIDE